MPQLFVWRSYVPFQHLNWSQCLQIWEIARLENATARGRLFDAESWYSIAHIGLIFWIPALIIVLAFLQQSLLRQPNFLHKSRDYARILKLESYNQG
ncbi:hypothetical protein ANCDUO_25970 [Ancylostoma duodenale]|uniref:Uncharacterized protein n=1 Tax=Ancylostoma duodenale TaxID=51022 RepID=A0A0C2FGD4_9BILA|nr:hypothetical protein ANCDUO_25970 [Ancylostoma duodenale]